VTFPFVAVVGKALHVIGKMAENVHVVITDTDLSLKAKNKQKTCLAEFTFRRDFFSTFEVPASVTEERVDMPLAIKVGFHIILISS
jgi:hypothetical protein